MPIMDGFYATEKIRDLEEENSWERMIIIGATANNVSESLQRKC